ncbi:MAG: VOC family protein [Oligoflexia bacterium]|nr:VOC family protein [Oligoflexia bacterium]
MQTRPIKKNEVWALIPARSGSKGVKGKNIYPICGHPLVAYSIITAKLTTRIDRVIVSTDSDDIADIAKSYGAEVPFIRPKNISDDYSTDLQFIQHAIDWFIANEGGVAEYIVHLRPTTPLRVPLILGTAIDQLKNNTTATSLRSAHLAPESPFKWFLKDQDGYFRSIIEGQSNETINLPRQKFQDVYIPDGYVDIVKTSHILQSDNLHGDKMIAFESPFCIEVDTIDDIQLLKHHVKKSSNEIIDQLNKFHTKKKIDTRNLRHIGIVTTNLERSFHFYTHFLGLDEVSRNREIGNYIDTVVGLDQADIEWIKLKATMDDTLIELLFYKNPKSQFSLPDTRANKIGLSHFSFTVREIERIYDSFLSEGYICKNRPTTSPEGNVKVMYCHDPDGNILELVEEISIKAN